MGASAQNPSKKIMVHFSEIYETKGTNPFRHPHGGACTRGALGLPGDRRVGGADQRHQQACQLQARFLDLNSLVSDTGAAEAGRGGPCSSQGL